MARDALDDEDGKADEGGARRKKKLSGKKLVLFIILPIVLLIAAAAGLWLSGLLGGDKEAHAEGHETKKEEKHAEAPKHGESGKHGGEGAGGVFFNVPDLLVNLSSAAKRSTFLKISLSLELGRAEDQAALEKLMPRVIDNFQVYLRELRLEDLKGSAGMYRLHEELLMRVNNAVQPVQVKDVLFREMLVQ
jgi:flagellar FliL protein